jgi:hypothetical protein
MSPTTITMAAWPIRIRERRGAIPVAVVNRCERQRHLTDPDLVAGPDRQCDRAFQPRAFEQGSVGTGVDDESLIACGVQPDLEVGAGDLRIVEHQSACLADPCTFTTDKELIKNRHAALRGAITHHNEVAQRLAGLNARDIDNGRHHRLAISPRRHTASRATVAHCSIATNSNSLDANAAP